VSHLERNVRATAAETQSIRTKALMPGRRVFFSFSYEQDIWRAANVRNVGAFDATARAGWTDASIWEEAKRKGDAEIRRLIDTSLVGTSVTAVLIGADTASSRWVTYEIEKSVKRGNGLLGVRVHRMKDQDGRRNKRGAVPAALRGGTCQVYDWQPSSFGRWVEHAALDVGKPCLRHQRKKCIVCRWLWWW
jgi:hypothetical protein